MKTVLPLSLLGFLLLGFLTHAVARTATDSSCTIKTFPRIYIIEDQKNKISSSDLIKESDCSAELLSSFISIIKETRGNIRKESIREFLNANIELEPQSIQVELLSSEISQRLDLDKDKAISRLEVVNRNGVVTLEEQEQLSVSCANCNNLGNKNLQLSISNPIEGRERKLLASAKILIRTPVLRLNKNLSSLDSLAEIQDAFTQDILETERPEDFFIGTDVLKYYKLNRNLAKGALLKSGDLTPLKIVRSGSLANIITGKNDLQIKSTGLAKESGALGDRIELYNQKTRKIISGKVIDFNTVKIEL